MRAVRVCVQYSNIELLAGLAIETKWQRKDRK